MEKGTVKNQVMKYEKCSGKTSQNNVRGLDLKKMLRDEFLKIFPNITQRLDKLASWSST